MQNDLIVFDFGDSRGREVLLRPEYIGYLADALQYCAGVVVRASQSDLDALPQWDGLNPLELSYEALLAAVQPGSIRIGFRLNISAEKELDWDKLKKVRGYIGSMIIGAGVLYGFIQPQTASGEKAASEAVTTAASLPPSSSKEVLKSVESLFSTAAGAGAEMVVIRWPEEPDCLVTLGDSISPKLLGIDAADPPAFQEGHVAGRLKIQKGVMTLLEGGKKKTFLLGSSAGTPSTTVLVDWQSEVPHETLPEEDIDFIGDFQPLQRLDLTAEGKMSPRLRHVAGVVRVTGVKLYR